MTDQFDNRKCGFVAVIGAPNVGKSTLVNSLVGSKVSIVTSKVQTTRALVRGIVICENSQVVFIDTPGIFLPKKKLERAMVAAAWGGQSEADIVMLVVDASNRKALSSAQDIIDKLDTKSKTTHILVLNKIDKIKAELLLALSEQLNNLFEFDATFMISALLGKGTKDLLSYLCQHIPKGPWHYPEDQASDMPLRLLSAEITREKLFQKLHQELPYGLTVETEGWEEFENGSIKINQIIYVSKASHKAMVLGKGGSMVKMIGQSSRRELEDILGSRVHLKLFVKIQENWSNDSERYLIWGLDPSA